MRAQVAVGESGWVQPEDEQGGEQRMGAGIAETQAGDQQTRACHSSSRPVIPALRLAGHYPDGSQLQAGRRVSHQPDPPVDRCALSALRHRLRGYGPVPRQRRPGTPPGPGCDRETSTAVECPKPSADS
jgi:hypothetical protein